MTNLHLFHFVIVLFRLDVLKCIGEFLYVFMKTTITMHQTFDDLLLYRCIISVNMDYY